MPCSPGRWGKLDRRWNWRVDCSAPPPADVTAAAWRERAWREEAGILHFASAAKPWHYYTDHPARSLYFEWVGRTAWAGFGTPAPAEGAGEPALLGREAAAGAGVGHMVGAEKRP